MGKEGGREGGRGRAPEREDTQTEVEITAGHWTFSEPFTYNSIQVSDQ